MINRNVFLTWPAFAGLEGFLKSISNVFLKGLGRLADTTLPDRSERTNFHLYSVALMEGLRFSTGLLGCLFNKHSLKISARNLRFCFLFACIAFVMSLLILWAFEDPNSDISVASFLSLSSIIYAVLLDLIFFGEKISIKQILGCGLFIVAGYCFLGFPNLAKITTASSWVWLLVIESILLAVNEAVSRSLAATEKAPSVYQTSFWVGIFCYTLFICALTIRGGWNVPFPKEAYLAAIANGFLITFGLITRVLSYKLGGSIVQKKFISRLTTLVLAIPIGVFIHAESFHLGKLLGVPFAMWGYYLVARKQI